MTDLFQCPECSVLHDAPLSASYVLEVACPECELLAEFRGSPSARTKRIERLARRLRRRVGGSEGLFIYRQGASEQRLGLRKPPLTYVHGGEIA